MKASGCRRNSTIKTADMRHEVPNTFILSSKGSDSGVVCRYRLDNSIRNSSKYCMDSTCAATNSCNGVDNNASTATNSCNSVDNNASTATNSCNSVDNNASTATNSCNSVDNNASTATNSCNSVDNNASTATTTNTSDTQQSSCCRLFPDRSCKQDIQINAGCGGRNSPSNNSRGVHAAPNIPLLFSNYNCSWASPDNSARRCWSNSWSLLQCFLWYGCWSAAKYLRKYVMPNVNSLRSQLALKSKFLCIFLLLSLHANISLAEKVPSTNQEQRHDYALKNSRNLVSGFDDHHQPTSNHLTNKDFANFFTSLPKRGGKKRTSGSLESDDTDFSERHRPRDSSSEHPREKTEADTRHGVWRDPAHGGHVPAKSAGTHEAKSGAQAPAGKHFAWKSAWQHGRKIPVLSIEPDGQRDRRSLALRLQSYLHHRPRHNHSHGKNVPSSSDQSDGELLQTSTSQDKMVGIPSGHHRGFSAKIPSSHHDGSGMKMPWNHSHEGNVATSDGDVRERRAKTSLRVSHSNRKRKRHPDITYSQNPVQDREAIDGYSGKGGRGSLEKSDSSTDIDRRKRAWYTQEFPQNKEIFAHSKEIFPHNEENLEEDEFLSSSMQISKSRSKHHKKHSQDSELKHGELTAGLVEEKNILRKEMLKLSTLDEERKMIEEDMEAIEEDIEEILERERRSLQFRREKILRRRERRKLRKENRRRRRMMRKRERQRNNAIRSQENHGNQGVVNAEFAISREFLEEERKKMREERRRKRIARRREKRRERRLRRRLRKRNKFKKNSKEANVVIDIVQFEQDTTNELHGHNACQYRDLLRCARETGLVAHPASATYSLQTAPRCLQRKNFLECMERQRSGGSQCSNSTTALGDLKRLRKHLRSAMFSNSSCLIAESIRS